MSALATSLHAPRWIPGRLERVLVVKTDHIGDFLLSLPAIRDFQATEPEAEIGYVVGSWNAPLAERVPWIREVHEYDAKHYVRLGQTPSPESRLREILDRNWDLVVDLSNERTSTLAALRKPAPHRRDLGTFRLREKLRSRFGHGDGLREEHVARVFYRALGLPVPDVVRPEPILTTEEDRAAAAELLYKSWPGDRPIVAMHVGATWEFRRWPAARFAQLARDLEGREYSVVLVGGPNDAEISAEMAEAAGLRPERNLAGVLSLPGTAALLERAALFVGNDGGPMHLAAAQGTPVVALFGPTNPNTFGPLGTSSRVIYLRRDCSPCSQRHCIWGRARCLEPLEGAEVLAAALEVAR